MRVFFGGFSPFSMMKEFKEFAFKGNVIDLAVGVVIGTAFGKIIASLVHDILMPLLGLILGRLDFSALAFTVGSASIKYGMFIQSVVDFLIVAFCVFLMIRQLQRFKKEAAPVVEDSKEVKLLSEIRDLLKGA